MGKAKDRGTYEQRKAQAIAAKQKFEEEALERRLKQPGKVGRGQMVLAMASIITKEKL